GRPQQAGLPLGHSDRAGRLIRANRSVLDLKQPAPGLESSIIRLSHRMLSRAEPGCSIALPPFNLQGDPLTWTKRRALTAPWSRNTTVQVRAIPPTPPHRSF